MELEKTARKLQGLQTVLSISKTLKISKRTAINYAYRLRKAGYLETDYGSNKVRMYRISTLQKKKRGYSLYELLNKNSRIKLATKEDYIIHKDEKPTIEEILVRAIITKQFRTILASLALFNKITNWSRLRNLAENYNLGRKTGALYDVARTIMRVRRMDKRTRKSFLRSKGSGYIIKNVRSKDYKEIENKWRVYIPFNKQDLEAYKEW